MPIIRSTLAEDVTRHAERIVSLAAPMAEVQVETDPRVPRGQPRPGGGPRLVDSFRFERQARRQGTKLTITARNIAPHARYTVEGTQPHPIVARRARALRWEGPQGIVFAKSVGHLGNASSSWWDDVLAYAWPLALARTALVL